MEPLYTFVLDHDIYSIYPNDLSKITNLYRIETKLRQDFVDFMETLNESSNYNHYYKMMEKQCTENINDLNYNYYKAMKIHIILNNSEIDQFKLTKLMKKYVKIIYKIKFIYDLVIETDIPLYTDITQRIIDKDKLLFIQHQFDCIMIMYKDIISNFSP